MGDGDGYSLCKSDCAPILLRPSPQEIVLGRLRGRIRRLFGEIAFFRLLGGEDASVGGHESTYPSFACMVLETKKGPCRFGKAPVFLQKWWGYYFRNLKLETIGGSIAVPLQTRKKQMRLRTIAMTIQIPITIQPRKGMTARTNESAVTTWIFRA